MEGKASGVTETVGAPRDFATRGPPPSKSICKRYDRHTRKPCPVLTCSKWVQTKIKQLQWFTVNIWVAQASSVARVNQWGREENVGVWGPSPQKNFEDTLCTLAQNTSPEVSWRLSWRLSWIHSNFWKNITYYCSEDQFLSHVYRATVAVLLESPIDYHLQETFCVSTLLLLLGTLQHNPVFACPELETLRIMW